MRISRRVSHRTRGTEYPPAHHRRRERYEDLLYSQRDLCDSPVNKRRINEARFFWGTRDRAASRGGRM